MIINFQMSECLNLETVPKMRQFGQLDILSYKSQSPIPDLPNCQ
jgi:hypothetical protein